MSPRARRGFALFELLVAVAIFAIMGVIAYRSLAAVTRAQKAGARVVLVGMKMPPNYGPDYTRAFEATFGELAKQYKTALVPFLLEDFAEKQELFQPDRIHPTAEAQPLMLERVWKALQPLLNREK